MRDHPHILWVNSGALINSTISESHKIKGAVNHVTMKVLICQEIKNLVWTVRERPVPGDNEALIKIKTVGICGTDIHAWAGNQPFFSYPRVLGHEICGEIIESGKNIPILISDSKLR